MPPIGPANAWHTGRAMSSESLKSARRANGKTSGNRISAQPRKMISGRDAEGSVVELAFRPIHGGNSPKFTAQTQFKIFNSNKTQTHTPETDWLRSALPGPSEPIQTRSEALK